jgi:ketopantoate reductase
MQIAEAGAGAVGSVFAGSLDHAQLHVIVWQEEKD